MRKYFLVVSAVVIMLCLGGIYAWSIFAVELQMQYGFTSAQSQIIFGLLISVFTFSMIWGKRLLYRLSPKMLCTIAGILFFAGNYIAFLSKGNFFIILFGVGIFVGIATGFGYLISLILPVAGFPHNKGLVTGIVTAGFGAGAVSLSYLSSYLLQNNIDILRIMLIIGIIYGILIISASQVFGSYSHNQVKVISTNRPLIYNRDFLTLLAGIFTGTFAGLLIIGNLKSIGLFFDIRDSILIRGIVLFSIANFAGRIIWGWINDYVSGNILIPSSVLLIGIFTLLAGHLELSSNLYQILSFCIGFCFGANFVIYARETAHIFGIANLGNVYPRVFLGYGLSGIIGPLIGGYLNDITGNFRSASSLSFILCCVTSVILIYSRISARQQNNYKKSIVN